MTALLAGWLADEAAGDPRRLHPVAWHGRLADGLERRLRMDGHRDGWRGDRRGAGLAYTGALVGLPTLAAGLAERRLRSTGPFRRGRAGTRRPAHAVLLAAATWVAVGGRSLRREATAVATAVADGRVDAARARLPALCGRDPAALDEQGLCRAAIESVAENTADAVVAPLVAGAVAGVPGVVAYRCANTLDAMVGYRTRGYQRFGWAAARLDDGLGWLPARLTAALVVLTSPVIGGAPKDTLAIWRRDGRRHPSPNAGVCEAAVAGALGVRLGGENHYGDAVETRGPQGDGPPPTPQDVQAAVVLSRVVGLAAAVLAAVVATRLGRWRG